MAIFRRRSPGGVECRGCKKIAIFDKHLVFISEIIQDGAIWNANRNSYVIYGMVLFRMTLSDLEWLSEIISDNDKHRAASLRQLSLLCILGSVCKRATDDSEGTISSFTVSISIPPSAVPPQTPQTDSKAPAGQTHRRMSCLMDCDGPTRYTIQ